MVAHARVDTRERDRERQTKKALSIGNRIRKIKTKTLRRISSIEIELQSKPVIQINEKDRTSPSSLC